MTQFKVGDRVSHVDDGSEGAIYNLASHHGQDSAYVGFPGLGPQWFDVGVLELVEEQPNRSYYDPIQNGPSDAAKEHLKEWRATKSTPVDPDHYKFPGGAEVIDISQWLTANAAQAFQYVARSSRIDGKNKGDASEDIRKAITFLEFELKRLEGE